MTPEQEFINYMGLETHLLAWQRAKERPRLGKEEIRKQRFFEITEFVMDNRKTFPNFQMLAYYEEGTVTLYWGEPPEEKVSRISIDQVVPYLKQILAESQTISYMIQGDIDSYYTEVFFEAELNRLARQGVKSGDLAKKLGVERQDVVDWRSGDQSPAAKHRAIILGIADSLLDEPREKL